MKELTTESQLEIIEENALKSASIDDLNYIRNYQQRKLYLKSEVDEYSVTLIVDEILKYNYDDKGIDVKDRKPILLYIASYGGSVDSGFELIDVIRASKTPVYTINMGYCYSMGLLILLCGHKRYSMITAKCLLHDGDSGAINSTSKMRDTIEFQNQVEGRVKDYVLETTKISSETYDSKLRVEWYMFADEAKELGMIDYIIGVDCDIDEIV